MVSLEDLGITTTLPDFCKGCLFNSLTLDDSTLYASNQIWVRNTNVTCEYIRVCSELYERLKKEGKLKDEVTS